MGVFDRLNVQYPLPPHIATLRLRDWQTKSLGRDMRTYLLSTDGELLDDDGERWPYTCDLTFHTTTDDENGQAKQWVECRARLVKGRIVQGSLECAVSDIPGLGREQSNK